MQLLQVWQVQDYFAGNRYARRHERSLRQGSPRQERAITASYFRRSARPALEYTGTERAPITTGNWEEFSYVFVSIKELGRFGREYGSCGGSACRTTGKSAGR